MTTGATVDVREVLERTRVGPLRIGVVAVCALVALLDGFDLQIIGLAAPSLAKALAIPTASLGTVFSAALLGLAVGGLAVAPLADRVGRRTVLLAAVLCFAVFTLATAVATGLPSLLTYRFLTGLGLGSALPCAVSLASEYVPARRRAATAGLLFAGLPVGGVLAGALGSLVLPATGWQGLFVIGGIVPVVVAVVMAVWLPESLTSLVARGAPAARIARVVARVAPGEDVAPGTRFVGVEAGARGVPVGRLVERGRRTPTVLLWASSFAVFLVLVVNSSWTPTLLAPLGLPVPRTAVALALFNAGSVVATAAGGWLIQRYGARAVIPPAFVLAAVGVLGVGLLAPSLAGVAAMEVLVGLGLGAASSGVVALAAVAYPTAFRSTGVGWAMGVGRIGSFVGPLVVAALVAASWAVPGVFGVLAAICLVGGLTALALRARRDDGASASSTDAPVAGGVA
ncbi:MFS transporter [Actinomycetospora sp. NBRC 106375]|uniref:MFS transporter n=1 Tax=Actinomycetospora sp. NBRC 106375 TaxID=3032207 RepID=UPI0024A25EF0|nr:MFS transporter [Actinomycetospora sp. NBRC 106375]GLZ46114.1 MFS transporter [Actinomycetospora sp. NBRC 106375]